MRKYVLATISSMVVTLLFSWSALALNPSELQTLATIDQHLRQIESNLKLAQESVGGGEGPPSPAKAKLAAVRLAQAVAAMPAVETTLATLKGEDQGLKAMQDRLAAATSTIQQLQDRLAGKAKTAAVADSTPSPGSTKKLDYRQEEQLRGADFNLREVEGGAQALAELVERLKPIMDQATIDHRQVATGMNTMVSAERKLGFAEEALKGLPAEGNGVAELRQRLDGARASLTASAGFLRPLSDKLTALVAPSSYPALDDDLRRLRELATMYGNNLLFQTRRQDAALLFKQKEAAQAEIERLAATYGPLIGQKTEVGNQLDGSIKHFTANLKAFLTAAEQSRNALPGEIRHELDAAKRLATDATTQQNVLPFVGGIPEHLARAEEQLELLQLLDAATSRVILEEISTTKVDLADRQTALATLIVKETPVPADRYNGGDKGHLTDMAVRSWKERQPDAKIVKTVFPAEQWSRTTRWEYANGTWTYVDYSRLQAQLLVVADEQKAVVRPINLTKDHQKNDMVRAVPLDGLNDTLIPQRYVLLAKLK